MPAFPKPRPHALAKADRAKELAAQDKAENAKVRRRSGYWCEVEVMGALCSRQANEIHHLIGGSGRRNRGKSILAEWKLHVCRKCHADITQHVLVPVRADADASAIVYERRI